VRTLLLLLPLLLLLWSHVVLVICMVHDVSSC
jgi:hypothetical protein